MFPNRFSVLVLIAMSNKIYFSIDFGFLVRHLRSESCILSLIARHDMDDSGNCWLNSQAQCIGRSRGKMLQIKHNESSCL